MTNEKDVVAAFVGPDNRTWQGSAVNVLRDGSWWQWMENDRSWLCVADSMSEAHFAALRRAFRLGFIHAFGRSASPVPEDAEIDAVLAAKEDAT